MRIIPVITVFIVVVGTFTGIFLINKYDKLNSMDVYNLYYEKDGYMITVHQVKPYYNTKTVIKFPVTLTYLDENVDLVIGNVGGISRHSVYYSHQELMGETIPFDMWDIEKMGEVGEAKSIIRMNIQPLRNICWKVIIQ